MSPHEQALRDILDPISYLERTMPAGCKLDGAAAIAAIEKPAIYQEIARKALAATPAPAPQGRELVPVDPTVAMDNDVTANERD